jgi:Lrp/AsnC family transcriptional regulator
MDKKINIKDRKLLLELEKDASLSYRALARKIGSNKDVIRYKISKFESNHLISHYMTHINIHKLGLVNYGLFISTKNMDNDLEKQFIDEIKDVSNVTYFAKTIGNYDFVFGILAKDPIELSNIIKKLFKDYSKYIFNKDIAIREYLEHFPKKYFMDKINPYSIFSFGGNLENIKLTFLDKMILSNISSDARISISDLAKRLKKPASTVSSRIKKLQKLQIVGRSFAEINSKKFGYNKYNIHIKLKEYGLKTEKRLHEFCEFHPNIVHYIKVLGKWDYEIGLEVDDIKEMYKKISEIKEIFKIDLDKIEFYPILDVIKYDLYPFD